MCLFALIASITPRLALLLMWIFTDWIDQAFSGILLPILGFIFAPLTTIVYALVWTPTGVTGAGIFFVVLAVLADLASIGGSAYGNRNRY